jgi:hypothetical protein
MQNNAYGMSFGNWMEPQQRPSVLVQVRSETIWQLGVQEAVHRVLRMLPLLGGAMECAKVSRIDPCVDILLRESDWQRDIEDGLVTRARDIDPHTQHRELTGFSIGRGALMCRLYDKWAEIVRKSHKFWMFDIWGTNAIPEDHRVIRIEFQLRREKIKGLGLATFDRLDTQLPGIWAYCTRKWLRVAGDAKKHHTHQKLRPWWSLVMDGFPGAQGAEPLVLTRAVNNDREILARQALGNLAGLVALGIGKLLGPDDRLPMDLVLRSALQEARSLARWSSEDFSSRVRMKQAKAFRFDEKGAGKLPDAQVPSGQNALKD